jgi:hypothetical protein
MDLLLGGALVGAIQAAGPPNGWPFGPAYPACSTVPPAWPCRTREAPIRSPLIIAAERSLALLVGGATGVAKMKHEEAAGAACAESGLVILDGPGPVTATMTPEAAVDTADQLLDAAAHTAGQRHMERSSLAR